MLRFTEYNEIKNPFLISWEYKSDWEEEIPKQNSSGKSILIPLEISKTEGKIIRSLGYSEPIQITSLYKFLNSPGQGYVSKFEKLNFFKQLDSESKVSLLLFMSIRLFSLLFIY